jgi:hypothetical protein
MGVYESPVRAAPPLALWAKDCFAQQVFHLVPHKACSIPGVVFALSAKLLLLLLLLLRRRIHHPVRRRLIFINFLFEHLFLSFQSLFVGSHYILDQKEGVRCVNQMSRSVGSHSVIYDAPFSVSSAAPPC